MLHGLWIKNHVALLNGFEALFRIMASIWNITLLLSTG
jgi:hypothetical protein